MDDGTMDAPLNEIADKGPKLLGKIGSGIKDAYNGMAKNAPGFTKWLTFGLVGFSAFSLVKGMIGRSLAKFGFDGMGAGLLATLVAGAVALYGGNEATKALMGKDKFKKGDPEGTGASYNARSTEAGHTKSENIEAARVAAQAADAGSDFNANEKAWAKSIEKDVRKSMEQSLAEKGHTLSPHDRKAFEAEIEERAAFSGKFFVEYARRSAPEVLEDKPGKGKPKLSPEAEKEIREWTAVNQAQLRQKYENSGILKDHEQGGDKGKFNKAADGMSYDQIEEVPGNEGEGQGPAKDDVEPKKGIVTIQMN